MTVRIAVIQQQANPGKVEENRAKAVRFAEDGLAQGADILLFHEEMLAGVVENQRELAEAVDGPTTRAFMAVLRGTDALVLYGHTERDGEEYFITATLVGAAGVAARYRKAHLWWQAGGARHEPSYVKAGSQLVTFTVKGHKSGVMICYDGDFPEIARSYARLDCTMLFWMNNRASRGYAEVKHLADNNSLIMATSCCCGYNELGGYSPGGSNIVDAQGRLLAEIGMTRASSSPMSPPRTCPPFRRANPWFTGQRRDLYV